MLRGEPTHNAQVVYTENLQSLIILLLSCTIVAPRSHKRFADILISKKGPYFMTILAL